MRWRFDGEIAGCGSSSGVRVVVGRWTDSPFGPLPTLSVMVTAVDSPLKTILDLIPVIARSNSSGRTAPSGVLMRSSSAMISDGTWLPVFTLCRATATVGAMTA